jgi:two-component system probable response regulator PhcQ
MRPIARGSCSPVTPTYPNETHRMTNSTATILLVDDEPNVTDALKRALRREPYEFLTATSGVAAQLLLERQHVDVVVSDEQMPGMSGSEFLSMVRKQFPHTIRIILSGQASVEAAVRAINEGEVHRFFLKPCNPTHLIVTIQQALSHKRLEEKSRRLLREYQRQARVLAKLNYNGPDLLRLDTDEHGAVVIDESDDEGDVSDLLAEIEFAIKGR